MIMLDEGKGVVVSASIDRGVDNWKRLGNHVVKANTNKEAAFCVFYSNCFAIVLHPVVHKK